LLLQRLEEGDEQHIQKITYAELGRHDIDVLEFFSPGNLYREYRGKGNKDLKICRKGMELAIQK